MTEPATESTRPPIFDAIDAGDLAVVLALIAADPAAAGGRDVDGLTALRYARYRGLLEIVDALLAAKPELDFWDAATVGDTQRLGELLDADASLVTVRSNDGMTPLGLAVFFDHPAAATLLIERGADLEQRSLPFGTPTPLHSAVAANHPATVRVLLQHGADPDAEQVQGWRALHSAAQHGNLEIVRMLLEHGADPLRTNDGGQTPSDTAAGPDRDEVVALLGGAGTLR